MKTIKEILTERLEENAVAFYYAAELENYDSWIEELGMQESQQWMAVMREIMTLGDLLAVPFTEREMEEISREAHAKALEKFNQEENNG